MTEDILDLMGKRRQPKKIIEKNMKIASLGN